MARRRPVVEPAGTLLLVTPELSPFDVCAGSPLGETVAQIARALRTRAYEIVVITPLHRGIDPQQHGLARRLRTFDIQVGLERRTLHAYEGRLAPSDVEVVFVDDPASFDRPVDEVRPDDHRRWFGFARAVLSLAEEYGWQPDVIMACGWRAGWLPLLLRRQEGPRTLGQPRVLFMLPEGPGEHGLCPAAVLDELQLGYDQFTPQGIEFHGQVSQLKAGLVHADRIVVGSPTFAQEVQTEAAGGGLHGLFLARDSELVGILGGSDPSDDPSRCHHLAARYDASDLSGKARCKHALQQALGLPTRSHLPLCVLCAPHLDETAGLGLLLEHAAEWTDLRLQIALVGKLDDAFAARVAALVRAHPMTFAHAPHLDARRVLAGADYWLALRHHDPAGLTLMRALAFGAVPIAHASGAAADIVVEHDVASSTGAGLRFSSDADLVPCLRRAVWLYEAPGFGNVTQAALRQRHGWERSASRYDHVLRQLLGVGGPG